MDIGRKPLWCFKMRWLRSLMWMRASEQMGCDIYNQKRAFSWYPFVSWCCVVSFVGIFAQYCVYLTNSARLCPCFSFKCRQSNPDRHFNTLCIVATIEDPLQQHASSLCSRPTPGNLSRQKKCVTLHVFACDCLIVDTSLCVFGMSMLHIYSYFFIFFISLSTWLVNMISWQWFAAVSAFRHQWCYQLTTQEAGTRDRLRFASSWPEIISYLYRW